jgi:hypothetical protein
MIEKTINAKEIGSLSPEDEELMAKGMELAKKFDLKLNGWWEISFTFTDMNSGNTFLAKDEAELIQKLKKHRPNESCLKEMPHVVVDEYAFDFKMEKNGWADRLIKYVHVVGKDKIDEVLAPFYGIYRKMFEVRYNKLSEEEKNLLRRKLPKYFMRDMGVE